MKTKKPSYKPGDRVLVANKNIRGAIAYEADEQGNKAYRRTQKVTKSGKITRLKVPEYFVGEPAMTWVSESDLLLDNEKIEIPLPPVFSTKTYQVGDVVAVLDLTEEGRQVKAEANEPICFYSCHWKCKDFPNVIYQLSLLRFISWLLWRDDYFYKQCIGTIVRVVRRNYFVLFEDEGDEVLRHLLAPLPWDDYFNALSVGADPKELKANFPHETFSIQTAHEFLATDFVEIVVKAKTQELVGAIA